MRDAASWAVMSSSNRVNGTYASESDTLLIDSLLKGEWGFDGIVYRTGSGRIARMSRSRAGWTWRCWPARWMGRHAAQAVESGALSMDRLDDKVRRLLRTMARVGAFERPGLQPEQAIDRPEHRAVARQAAAEAIVLLKNDHGIRRSISEARLDCRDRRPAAHPLRPSAAAAPRSTRTTLSPCPRSRPGRATRSSTRPASIRRIRRTST
ncbi:MAG: hypothetical protein U0641_04645 [Anaerolineae bacterium]